MDDAWDYRKREEPEETTKKLFDDAKFDRRYGDAENHYEPERDEEEEKERDRNGQRGGRGGRTMRGGHGNHDKYNDGGNE